MFTLPFHDEVSVQMVCIDIFGNHYENHSGQESSDNYQNMTISISLINPNVVKFQNKLNLTTRSFIQNSTRHFELLDRFLHLYGEVLMGYKSINDIMSGKKLTIQLQRNLNVSRDKCGNNRNIYKIIPYGIINNIIIYDTLIINCIIKNIQYTLQHDNVWKKHPDWLDKYWKQGFKYWNFLIPFYLAKITFDGHKMFYTKKITKEHFGVDIANIIIQYLY